MALELQEFNGYHGKADTIELVLAGHEELLIEQYQIKASVLTQPSIFSLRIGWQEEAVDILRRYPPGTPFQLKINGIVYMTGKIDGQSSSGSGPTAITFKGRDALAALHDAYVEKEFSITQATYAELVRKCLDAAGLTGVAVAYSNKKNRAVLTGGGAHETTPPRDVEGEKIESEQGGPVKRPIQAQLGERLYEMVKKNLDRAGLFLWTAGDGTFVLSEPNPNQTPAYLLLRLYSEPERSNIIDDNFENDTTSRFSEAVVYIKSGGKKFGRTQSSTSFVDEEMTGWGFKKKLVVRDAEADSPKKAEFLARRRIAESRRAGRKLSYTVMGHTMIGPTGARAIWAPDTVARVVDNKYGFEGLFYVEAVTLNGQPHVTTTVDLMRIEDVVFSDKGAK